MWVFITIRTSFLVIGCSYEIDGKANREEESSPYHIYWMTLSILYNLYGDCMVGFTKKRVLIMHNCNVCM